MEVLAIYVVHARAYAGSDQSCRQLAQRARNALSLGYGLAAAYSFGAIFAIVFGVLSTVGQVFAYRLGIRPTMDYQPATRPRLTKRQLRAIVNRIAGYAVTGYASAAAAHQTARAVGLGLKVGLIGFVLQSVQYWGALMNLNAG